ncbi:packaged DNA stabilization protein [Pigmentiphaga daeguensis]|uniref:Bacteriophage P22, Gp10, DNA-stabilising n=1 Tax=Pigmentiphaga daeguensis TaxID=414049 RepID=A0ABP3N0C7_9BURK
MAKSLIASAQRCVNLYMELNPKDSTFPTTHYPTPGLVRMAQSARSGWRCLYTASNGTLYGVCGAGVYAIAEDGTLTELGAIASSSGPCSMVDNGTSIVLVDNTSAGYTIRLDDNQFVPITQDSFYGGNTVQYSDGFFVLPRTGTTQFYISLAFQTEFDATDFASKVGFSDKLVTLAITKRYLFLLGTLTTEVWYNAGGDLFPYARMPGAFIQHGCIAPFSVAQMDGSVYWLSQSPQGKCIVVRTEDYAAARISTHAIENEIQSYPRVDDAQAFTMQIDGHFWYVLTFPTANKTWVFDLSTSQWHEWLWLDQEGAFNRHRAACFAFAYGQPIVGDWENGNLYRLDPLAMTDDGGPVARIRSFPHMVDDDSSRVMYREFIAAFQVGTGAGNQEVPVFLRYSDTAGRTWGNPIRASFGAEGDYLKSIQFQRLGMARDRVFELSWSAPVHTALNGAFVQYKSANQ